MSQEIDNLIAQLQAMKAAPSTPAAPAPTVPAPTAQPAAAPAVPAPPPFDPSTFAGEIAKHLAAAMAPQPAPAPAPRPNISDRGTAAPADLRDSEGVVNSRPLEVTGHDIDVLMLKHGPDKGLQMFQERVLHALRGVKLRAPRGGR